MLGIEQFSAILDHQNNSLERFSGSPRGMEISGDDGRESTETSC